MRIFIEESSKKELLSYLKSKYRCYSLFELSEKLNIKKKTLEGWFYIRNRSIPEEFLGNYETFIEMHPTIKVADNWGQIAGGKKGYLKILERYGATGVKNIQALGGINSAKTKDEYAKNFKVNIKNELFLEIYGALLGDGWLGNLKNPNTRWSIGLCGNLLLDKDYILYCRKIIQRISNRKGYLYERINGNTIEFRFKHKWFFKYLNEELSFPAGKKENLRIHPSVYSLGYSKVKYVLRGIFDTDGSFHLARNRRGIPSYPCISIHMKEPVLMNQLFKLLHEQGFRVIFERSNNQIRMKGIEQLKLWMRDIGSSNPKHLMKMKRFISQLKQNPSCQEPRTNLKNLDFDS